MLACSQWFSVVVSGCQWFSVVVSGCQWLSVVVSGCQWLPVVVSVRRKDEIYLDLDVIMGDDW